MDFLSGIYFFLLTLMNSLSFVEPISKSFSAHDQDREKEISFVEILRLGLNNE